MLLCAGLPRARHMPADVIGNYRTKTARSSECLNIQELLVVSRKWTGILLLDAVSADSPHKHSDGLALWSLFSPLKI